VTVAIIFIPLVVQSCRILKIEAAPYLFGIAICLNIGNIFAPFSNSQNILIANEFYLTFLWFAQYLIPFLFIASLSTIFIIDIVILKKQPIPTEEQKRILLELMNPEMVIINRKKFLISAFGFLVIVVWLLIIPQAFIVAIFGAIGLHLATKDSVEANIRQIDWKIIIIFISLFLIIGCMIINGTIGFIAENIVQITGDNLFIACLSILILSSLITSFIAPGAATVMFIPIFHSMFLLSPNLGLHSDFILMIFILGVNVGGNFFPQGAPCYIAALNVADKYHVKDFTYKEFIKIGTLFSVIHMGLIVIYLTGYLFFAGLLV
jgi:Na+/H+ antiporter NhaD/arsenite permease-like protein